MQASMPKRPLDLLQGTLDLLILGTLSWGPAHGYAIARWIGQRGRRQLLAETGTWTDFAAAVGRVLAATERPE